MRPLLSVVIPTKNRYTTLFPLVRALAEFASENIEIVINDNSDDNNEAIEFFSTLESDFVHYYHTVGWVSVVDNCDLAINHSKGEYVSFIGDDDAVIPEIVDVVKLMKKYNIDSCCCNYSIYKWYSDPERNIYPFSYRYSNNKLNIPDCMKLVKNTLKNGVQNKRNFPGVYHGITSRKVLDIIYEKTGSYFPGPSPDMANAFAIALIPSVKHINIFVPIVIDGYSKVSTGRLTETKQHIGKLEDQSFLPKDTVEKWTPELPNIWLPNTIWPQSAIQAIKRMKCDELLQVINYEAVYMKIWLKFPEMRKICQEYSKRYSGITNKISTFFSVGISYIKNRINDNKKKTYICIKEQITIESAIKETSKIIKKNQMINTLDEQLSLAYRGGNEKNW